MNVLLPLSWLYAFVMLVRNRLFDWRVLRSEDVGVPVISIGNLTVGGTGKTPLVEHIVKHLLEQKRRVAVVSRGYKRMSKGVVVVSDGTSVQASADQSGDEPQQIAQKFREAVVVVGEKRVDAAKSAVQLGAEVIIMDDGFQHRYLARDLDIAVVDATGDITADDVLPAGRLREPLSGLRRAGLVAFSRSGATAGTRYALESKLRPYYPGAYIKYRNRILDVRNAKDDGIVSSEIVRTMRLVAFSGIGNHDAFMHELGENGFASLGDMRFTDHHPYSDGDVATLASFARASNADACLTTEKDIVRLRSNRRVMQTLTDGIPVFYIQIEVEILEGEMLLHSHIDNCVSRRESSGGGHPHGHRHH